MTAWHIDALDLLNCTTLGWRHFALIAFKQIAERGHLQKARIRRGTELSTCASRSRAHFSASALLSKDLQRGFSPQRRICACQRPLSLRIVAIVISGLLI